MSAVPAPVHDLKSKRVSVAGRRGMVGSAIAELARMVKDVVGYQGTIALDRTRPDGTPRKLLDVSRLHGLGWRAKTRPTRSIRALV